ncbi:MAG: AraC family transcriptional regulator [Sterolibacteriaceae bacterium]|nr:AraC family transcriptional regulator [Sterolibacteriaceae bacterium]
MFKKCCMLFAVWVVLAVATSTIARAENAPTDASTSDPGVAPPVTPAAEGGAKPANDTPANATLDDRIQSVKGDVIQLNRDLMVLEEELLFPANTQLAVFVSMDVGKLFSLDSVQVKLDDKVVANYLYAPGEVQALHRGGVQRLYLGNLRAGEHELVALFVGGGPHERDYRRGATVKFEKGTEPKYIELRIADSTNKLQPEFEVKIWQ